MGKRNLVPVGEKDVVGLAEVSLWKHIRTFNVRDGHCIDFKKIYGVERCP